MLSNIAYPTSGIYRTGSDYEPLQFYLETLAVSNRFDLLLGYFSSSAIHVLSLGFAKFLYNGGQMRMVINHILSEQDKEAILKGATTSANSYLFDIQNIKQIKSSLDDYGKHFFECLAWLIASKRLQIKIVRPNSNKGIAHYKSGILSDGKNRVGFTASCNFTATALLENLEQLNTFQSWENSKELAKIEDQERYFEQIFSGRTNFLTEIPPAEIEIAIYNEFGNKDINDLLVQEKALLDKKRNSIDNKKYKKLIDKIELDIFKILNEPRFPYPEGARNYQQEAYQNWLQNNQKGIFAMATGTGKTLTALHCVLEEYRKKEIKSYRILILVPTISLLEQWAKEVKKFNYNDVIKIASDTNWENELALKLSFARRLLDTNFAAIVTYTTFAREKFQSFLKRFPSDTILIADEAHNIASSKVLSTLSSVPLHKRIALSATPKRIYDPEGTIIMQDFFNDKEPYTYSFSMERAIEEGVLCKYYYYPHIVKLTTDEFKKYQSITQELMKYYDVQKGQFKESEQVTRLLLERKRVIHKAENKLEIMTNVLKKQFQKKGDLKYTLIYVPEGIESNNSETFTENEDEIRLINQYCEQISQIDPNINVSKFVSGIEDREFVLKQFEQGNIHVLASMKCLDEGVDVPRSEFAVFCSSTGNPRQFIQRRGRILRKHPDKHIATIHDLVVVPDYEINKKNNLSFNMERNLTRNELQRVMYFASLAFNPYETENVFRDVCDYYELNLATIKNELKSV